MSSPDMVIQPESGIEQPSATAADALLNIVAIAIGLIPALDRFLPYDAGSFSLSFVLAVAFSALGYWVGTGVPPLRVFRLWMVAFAAWAVVTVVATGPLTSLKESAGNLAWFLAVPGIASLCFNRSRLRSLLFGLLAGSGVLLVVVASRFVRGASILDEGFLQLLGVNRNVIDITIVSVVPVVLWSKTLALPRIARVLFLALSLVWVISSEGRTGFVAMLMVPFVFALLKQSGGLSRIARVAVIATIAALIYVSLSTAVIPGLPATARITRYNSSDRSEADQIRTVLNEKSLALARKHPVTGVGFGKYKGQYDPVIDKGENEDIREKALELPAHNTYYEILATTGIPGFVLFVGALLVALVAGVKNAWDPDVRALTTSYVIVLFCIAFHTSYGALVMLPTAVLLAAVGRARMHADAA